MKLSSTKHTANVETALTEVLASYANLVNTEAAFIEQTTQSLNVKRSPRKRDEHTMTKTSVIEVLAANGIRNCDIARLTHAHPSFVGTVVRRQRRS